MSVMSVITGVRTAERVAAPLPTAELPALGGSSDEADSTIDNIVTLKIEGTDLSKCSKRRLGSRERSR